MRKTAGVRAVAAFVLNATLMVVEPPFSAADDDPRWVVLEDEACPVHQPRYARDVWFRLERYTTLELTERLGRGIVSVHFYIGADGRVADVVTLRKKGPKSVEATAHDAIAHASPFAPPGFAEDHCERIGVTVNFCFNMSEKACVNWLRQPPEAPAASGGSGKSGR
jgi:hypothetical protein